MGDFNAKIGQREEGEDAIRGQYGYGNKNKRGENLTQFAQQNKLLYTYFKKN